jgi:hypothetical protein
MELHPSEVRNPQILFALKSMQLSLDFKHKKINLKSFANGASLDVEDYMCTELSYKDVTSNDLKNQHKSHSQTGFHRACAALDA